MEVVDAARVADGAAPVPPPLMRAATKIQSFSRGRMARHRVTQMLEYLDELKSEFEEQGFCKNFS